ncbi:MAG: NAD(P)-dependent oxidoreductase [Mycobacteriales bacterium]
MTVVVTGAAGFIGRHLVASLAAQGHSVVGVDRHDSEGPAVQHIVADLLDADDVVDTALREATAVFHLAGCPGVRDQAPDVAHRRWRDNVLAAERVLAAVPLTTPLVVTSSSSVYGGATGRGCREDDPVRPRGGYAMSKVEVERRCLARLCAGGSVAIARPFTVAGEGQRSDMAFAQWIEAARAGLPLQVLGSGARTRDVTDVRDVVRALMMLGMTEGTGLVNIGTGRAHRLDTLAALVSEVTHAPAELRVVPADPDEAVHTRADTTRLERLTGFVPTTDLRALVARQYAAACEGMSTVAAR